MGDRVAEMLRQALVVFEKSDPRLAKEVEKSDNVGRRAARGDQALHGQGLEVRDVGRGEPALCRDHHLHDQSRACRRHHRQEPDGTGRQEDQEPLHVLARGPGGNPQIPCPRDGQHAACLQRVRDPRRRDGAPAARREGHHPRGRACRRRQPFRAAARGPAGIDRDQRDPSRRDARPQAHQRASDLGRLPDPRGRGRIARQPPARARGRRGAGAERQAVASSVRDAHCNRISAIPATIITAATMRLARSGSFRNTTAIAAANSTLVSRSAATMAIGATVIAQITIQ